MKKILLIIFILFLIFILVWFAFKPKQKVYSWDDVIGCTLPAIGATCRLKNGETVPYGPQWDGSQGVKFSKH